MAEQFANSATSTLSGSIDASQTVLTVQNGSVYPLGPQFRLRIEQEILLVTGVSGNQFTVVRGVEGTTPAPHFLGVDVAHILTAGGLVQGITEIAADAAAEAAGDIALGAAQEAIKSPAKLVTSPPTDASFSSVPSPGALAIDTVSGLYYFRTPTVNTFATFVTTTGGALNIPGNSLQFAQSATNPTLNQASRTSGAGQPLTIAAQSTSDAAAGGNLILAGGAGVSSNGIVQMAQGGTVGIQITPTATAQSRYQVVLGPTSVLFNQADVTSGSATGAPWTVQAQNATGASSTGGALNLTSGTGTTVAGNVNIQTGGTTRVSVTPTTVNFADNATALTITPVSAGTTTITLPLTALGFTMSQTSATGTSGAFWQILSQSTSFDTGTGGTLSLVAGNATGTNGTGGSVDVRAGTGNTANGTINFRLAGTTFAQWRGLTASVAQLQWVSSQTPTINQATTPTNSATGATFTIQAQNASGTTSTGGALTLTSGTGTTVAGNVNIQCGGTNVGVFSPTAFTLTPAAFSWPTATVSPTISQANDATNSITGDALTIQAQNATGTTATGGNVVITSGTGTSAAGTVILQTGGTNRFTVASTGFTLNAAAFQWASNVVNPLFRQNDDSTNGITGDPLVVQAQNATGTTSTGGALTLTSGTGTAVAGNVDLQTGGTSRFLVTPTIITVGLATQQFATAVASPVIRQQDDATNSITGDALTVQAQNATGTTTTGGALVLSSGTGTTTHGAAKVQVGGVDVISCDSRTQVTHKAVTHIYSGDSFGTVTEYLRSVSTSNNTVTDIFTWTITDEAVTLVDVAITVIRDTGAVAGAYKRQIVFKRDGGTVSTVSASVDNLTGEDSAGLDVTVDNSTSTGRVRVTGITSENYRWLAAIRLQETRAT